MKYKFGKKFLTKPLMTKTSQDNNWIIINNLNFMDFFNAFS